MTSTLDLKGRSILTLNDLSDREFIDLIDLAIQLKRAKCSQAAPTNPPLAGKNIALLFQKASTRTRCAAIIAAHDLGAHAEYLGQQDIHIGKKETVADTARVLGRMFDGILFRGFKHETVETLARHAGTPVWNGLTDSSHPSQILADLQTMKEYFGYLGGLNVVYVGDGRNNVCNSLMLGCAKAGIHFVNCCPAELNPSSDRVDAASRIAAGNGSTVRVCNKPDEAAEKANVIYTDVWVSMGEESEFDERLRLLRPFQVNMPMMKQTGNLDGRKVIFLHCLPAFHNSQTAFTAETGALEVADDVFEAPFSKVFDQAENRMHTIKAMMLATVEPWRQH